MPSCGGSCTSPFYSEAAGAIRWISISRSNSRSSLKVTASAKPAGALAHAPTRDFGWPLQAAQPLASSMNALTCLSSPRTKIFFKRSRAVTFLNSDCEASSIITRSPSRQSIESLTNQHFSAAGISAYIRNQADPESVFMVYLLVSVCSLSVISRPLSHQYKTNISGTKTSSILEASVRRPRWPLCR